MSTPITPGPAHANPHASPQPTGTPDTLAARMQAVEIVVTETLAALINTRPEAWRIAPQIAARTRRHIARMPADDAAFALELDRQTTRLLRNIALRLGIETVKG